MSGSPSAKTRVVGWPAFSRPVTMTYKDICTVAEQWKQIDRPDMAAKVHEAWNRAEDNDR